MNVVSGKLLVRLAALLAAVLVLCVPSVNAQIDAGANSSVPTRFDDWDPSVLQKADQFKVGTTYLDGKSIDKIVVPGRPPVGFRAPVADIVPSDAAAGIVILSNVPAFDWCYGCSATSAAMAAGYYDNVSHPNMYAGPTNSGVCPMTNAAWGSGECPLSATHMGYDGRAIRGHVDDYWIAYNNCNTDPWVGNWAQHTYGDCTGDYMGTNQSSVGSCDGSTTFYNYTDGSPLYDYTGCEPSGRDGCHGVRLFVESRGYTVTANYSQYILGYNGNTLGFTYDQYKAEIDAGRPVLIQLSGHTMLGYGYNTTGSLLYVRDTWDYAQHQMTWGGSYSGLQHYGVMVLILGPGSGVDVYEPDDIYSQAKSLTPGTVQSHSIKPVGDQDWAKFTLDRESGIQLSTSGVSGDTRMWLYDSNLTEIAFDDNSGPDGFSLIGRDCGVNALPAGDYYVKVDESGNDSEIAGYDLLLEVTACGEACSTDVPKNIDDGYTVYSTLNIPDSKNITNVDVRLNIEHTYDADIEVALEHPDGTAVVLFSHVGGSGDNFTDTVLDDSAGTAIASGSAPFTGSYRPQNPLSALNGKDSLGTWRLRITDSYAGDVGALVGWCLMVSDEGCIGPTITEHPWSIIRCDGESATFSVTATGPEPLRYQWRLGGIDIDGATSSTYTIDPVTSADTGDYDCVVTNDCNSVTSNTAQLWAGPCSTISEAKALGDGESVVMRHAIATAGFADQWCIYLEQPDRASGIYINGYGDLPWPGGLLDVAGNLATNEYGERYIAIQSGMLTAYGDSLAPVGMPNKLLGGGDWEYDSLTGAGQRGVTGGFGLNNIGLLVRTCGIVQSVDAENYSYVITDGSPAPVTVVIQSTEALPTPLSLVSVTGISSCVNVDGQINRILLAIPEPASAE